ncbi:terminase gpA endonuclease subunit [Crateriforma spongiae]|uniref:terminase gpA endonuclease subunit n=1 Tax=Crateriforma spongiae TaxID=2724528 RepID=UPI0039B00504
MPPDYDEHRRSAAERSRKKSEEGREIGRLPRRGDAARRRSCAKSLKRFCTTYLVNQFNLEWSPDHHRCIKKMERAVLKGELFALAMPRGSGKTTLCEAACLWAILYGYRRFIVLIGSDKDAAKEMLDSIKTELETNDLLLADFPEVCFPIRALQGIHSRCNGQTCGGVRTRMKWTDYGCTLPTVKRSKCSGSRILCRGLTGRIRGLKAKTAAGEQIRPDLVIVDDPQTEESAKSEVQNQSRVGILTGAVLGLAGPGKNIAGMMPCTVIEPNDMADQILNRELYPQWQGDRIAYVKSWPKDRHLWDEYCELLRADLAAERGSKRSTEFYAKHRKAMDDGFVVYWQQRKSDEELSANQHFWNAVVKLGPQRVAAEYQQDPRCPELVGDDFAFDWHIEAKVIITKLSGYDRGLVPDDCQHMTGMIDVHGDVLYWGVVGWTATFTGWVVDYGTWPRQRTDYFSKASAQRTLAKQYAGEIDSSETEALIHRGLTDLVNDTIARAWRREDGSPQHVGLCMIDANWGEQADTVYDFAARSDHARILLPSHGRGIGASRERIDAAPQKPGEIVGHHWRMPSLRKSKRKIRYMVFDSNTWKVFVFRRLATARGSSGCLELPGRDPIRHQMIADHCRAETPQRTEGPYGERVEWAPPAPGVDNHFFDVMVGNCVAASRLGCQLPGVSMTGRGGGRRGRGKSRMRLSEMRKPA